MTIKSGQKLPNATLMRRLEDKTQEKIAVNELVAGRKIALVGLPGAFTGTCTGEHIPNLIARMPDIRAKGVDDIIVFAVNDPQVMLAWDKITGAGENGITLLADPSSEFTEALGLRFDAVDAGLIGRCTRFAAIVDDGVVQTLLFEKGPMGCALTGGDAILDALT